MNVKKTYAVAVDGPAGAGKSTVAKKVAEVLNIEYIDTGAMYRALTYKVLKEGIDPLDSKEVIRLLGSTKIDFNQRSIYLDNVNVDSEIRLNRVSQNVSYIAAIEKVREEMVMIQQNMAKEKSIIMDGRDIGTVVLPDAEFKFFITASSKERAKRRYEELLRRGEVNISLEEIQSDIEARDNIDSNRKVGPLKQAPDAHLIDTTNKTVDECVKIMVSTILGGN